ncbi:unnamed protein product [Cylindrotheca closterium]|uniref:Uncharacterized protein n=1 Tax=Cylindrotheca closterium TaxID=2856 RepID=A0AAD2FPE1_9STRA|nr:unnamed protein product [Cylindrotheca closterium]
MLPATQRIRLQSAISRLVYGVVLLAFLFNQHAIAEAVEDKPFQILCTTTRRYVKVGSYKIRCHTFKRLAEHFGKNVEVTVVPQDQLYPEWKGDNAELVAKKFDATVVIKRAIPPEERFGKMFMDVVDSYTITHENLDPAYDAIVQSIHHGNDIFSNRTFHVVEHWYNSFPQDMMASTDLPVVPLPPVHPVEVLKLGTLWTNEDEECAYLHSPSMQYTCISEKYRIELWYQDYFEPKEKPRVDALLSDPDQGTGRLYFELFWKFDVLVVPAKAGNPAKLRFGNVQRAVSQMRSGVPILLEIYGDILEDFMDEYNYPCAYVVPGKNYQARHEYMTFEKAVLQMKKPDVRRACQEAGIRIAKDYSPFRIVKKQLEGMGYKGEFNYPKGTTKD